MTNENTQEFDRPDAPMIGADGNIFAQLGIASKTLKRHGYRDRATEMTNRVQQSGSYMEALAIIQEYVTPVEQ